MTNLENLKKYKYTCADNSITSKYILTPFHTKLCTYIPPYISPNLLTILGFMCALLGAIITLLTDPFLNNQKYPIVKLLNAFLLFTYQIFDSLDGKQARKLNLSTPLGQLLDHGVDALVIYFTSICLTSTLQLGTFYLYFILIPMLLVYFLCLLEECYTDMFYLGYINGPTEGILLGILAHVISYFKPEFLHNIFTHKYYNFNIYLIFVGVFSSLCIMNSFIYILRNKKRGTFNEIWNMFMKIYSLFISTIIFLFHANFNQMLWCNYFSFMFMFGKFTFEMAYMHLTLNDIKSFDSFYYLYILINIVGLYSEIRIFVWVLVLAAFLLAYVEKVVFIVNEICGYLKIDVFTVPKEKKD